MEKRGGNAGISLFQYYTSPIQTQAMLWFNVARIHFNTTLVRFKPPNFPIQAG